MPFGLIEEVVTTSEEGVQGHDDALAQGIDGRVGDLREPLTEVHIEWSWLVRQYGQGRIVAHRPLVVLAVMAHRLDDVLDVFERVAKGTPQRGQVLARWCGRQ